MTNRSSRAKRPFWVTALLVVAAAAAYLLRPPSGQPSSSASSPAKPGAATRADAPREVSARSDGGITQLFRSRKSDAWVEASGRVVKLLPDDNQTDDGRSDRHQRMLIEVGADVTVLLAHNIDVASRVPVQAGDTLRFRGEYEWTEKGGTVHFTHAPKYGRSKQGGWIEFAGKRYE